MFACNIHSSQPLELGEGTAGYWLIIMTVINKINPFYICKLVDNIKDGSSLGSTNA